MEIYDDITATAPGRVDDILRMEPEEAAWGRVCFEGENSGGAKIIIYKYDGEWYCREGDL